MKEYKVIVTNAGTVEWYNCNWQLDRENGPALERKDGYKLWYRNGLRHREDGPAIISPSGYETYYYLNDENLSKQEHERRTKSRDGEIIEEYGRKYKLIEIKENEK